jgi:hypothetical protein
MSPARIATAAIGSRVEVGESTVEVGPQSAVRLSGDDAHGISVLLDTGRVECDVAPRRGRPPFLVEAGAVEVRVIGTHFVVTRAGDAVTVAVQRGRVEVISGQEHAFVDAGSRWPPALAVQTSPAAVAVPPQAGAEAAGPEAPAAMTAAPATELAPRAPAADTRAAPAAAAGGSTPAARPSARERQSEATRLLDEYLARYPFGPNAEDARRLLARMR